MDDLRIHRNLVIPSSELRESFVRSAGPGGQNVNKVATKVELRWIPAASTVLSDWQRQRVFSRLGSRLVGSGELVVTCETYRSQLRNREGARAKLAEMIAGALRREKTRKKTKPTRSSVRKRVEGKRRRSETKRRRAKPRLDE